MAEKQIIELPPLADPDADDQIPVQKTEGGVGSTGRLSIAEVHALMAHESRSKFTDLLLASVDVKGLYITNGASDTFSIGVCYGGDQNNVVEYNFRPDVTGLWLVNGCRSGFTETFNVSGNYTPALVGDFTLSTGSTSGYTTTVGDRLIFSFDGPSLEVRFPSDERGGVWRFWIDGVATDISTFTPSASITTIVEEVATGLNVDQTHTGFAEFIGDDPSNPPVGGISRGWVYFRDTSTGTEYPTAARALQSKRGDSVGQLNTGAMTWNLISAAGVNEFAMLIRKAGSAQPVSWIPSHNNEMVFDSVETSVIIDGRAIDPENVTETRTINKFVMEQSGIFRQLNEPDQLGRLTMRHSVDESGKIRFGYRIELFQDIEVTTWYPVQYQVGKQDMTKLVLSNGAEIDLTVLSADESVPLFYRDVTSAAFLGAGSAGRYQGSAIDVDTLDAYQLMRKGLNVPDGSNLLNSRSAQDDYKLYWRANRTNPFLLEAGETIHMYCEWAAVSGVLQPNRLGALDGSSLL